MTFSSYDSYVVVTFIPYSGISADLDRIHTDKDEAQRAADADNDSYKGLGSSLRASVMTLDDYIDEVKKEARWDTVPRW